MMENNHEMMNDDLNNQNYIYSAPISVPIEKTSQILEQLKKSVHKLFIIYFLSIIFIEYNYIFLL